MGLIRSKPVPYTVFSVGHYTFGFPTSDDAELKHYEEMVPSDSPGWIKGTVLIHHLQDIPVVDMRKVLAIPGPPTPTKPRILIIPIQTRSFNFRVGILIEDLHANISVLKGHILATRCEAITAITGAVAVPEVGIIFVLNPAKIFSITETRQLANYGK